MYVTSMIIVLYMLPTQWRIYIEDRKIFRHSTLSSRTKLSMGSLINLAKYWVDASPNILAPFVGYPGSTLRRHKTLITTEYLALVQLRLILFISLVYFLAAVALSTYLGNHFVESLLK